MSKKGKKVIKMMCLCFLTLILLVFFVVNQIEFNESGVLRTEVFNFECSLLVNGKKWGSDLHDAKYHVGDSRVIVWKYFLFRYN